MKKSKNLQYIAGGRDGDFLRLRFFVASLSTKVCVEKIREKNRFIVERKIGEEIEKIDSQTRTSAVHLYWENSPTQGSSTTTSMIPPLQPKNALLDHFVENSLFPFHSHFTATQTLRGNCIHLFWIVAQKASL
jgi:hypothetical protein